jgi:hypothetical protein
MPYFARPLDGGGAACTGKTLPRVRNAFGLPARPLLGGVRVAKFPESGTFGESRKGDLNLPWAADAAPPGRCIMRERELSGSAPLA